jgi:hypothetical protein
VNVPAELLSASGKPIPPRLPVIAFEARIDRGHVAQGQLQQGGYASVEAVALTVIRLTFLA